MSYTVPVAADFTAAFPELAGLYTDPHITAQIALAARLVDTTWLEADFAPAILFLTAHYLTYADEAGGGGLISSESLGQVSLSYNKTPNADTYTLTIYGVRYLELLSLNVGAPVLIV